MPEPSVDPQGWEFIGKLLNPTALIVSIWAAYRASREPNEHATKERDDKLAAIATKIELHDKDMEYVKRDLGDVMKLQRDQTTILSRIMAYFEGGTKRLPTDPPRQ